jgi:hypothetical protein
MLEAVNLHLEARGIRIATGTIVDATIIHAPSLTRNATGERDPEMHQTRKGRQWYFGFKLCRRMALGQSRTSRSIHVRRGFRGDRQYRASDFSSGYTKAQRLKCRMMENGGSISSASGELYSA